MAETHNHGAIHEEEDNEDGPHVHFPEDVTTNTDIQLQIKKVHGKTTVNVHLGFLQYKHKYEVQFSVPVSPESEKLTPSINTPFIAVGTIKTLEDNKGHQITLELDAHKEGLLRDKFVLKNEAGEEYVIVLHARCLGLRKGTPMLKENIRCIQHPEKEDEEYSDWQGFD